MRILLIENFSPLRRTVEENLRESGYVVDSTDSGEEGLWYARNHIYDLIVLDLMLPQIDGMSILTTLRKNKNSTPVIITSARDTVEQRVQGLDAGANDYSVKPFDLDELLARIRANIRIRYEKPTDKLHRQRPESLSALGLLRCNCVLSDHLTQTAPTNVASYLQIFLQAHRSHVVRFFSRPF